MAFCSNCGTALSGNEAVCPRCGSAVPYGQAASSPAPAYTPYDNSYAPRNYTPAHIDTTGLFVWSIITLLLCTIPGIVALVKTGQINKCATLAQQQETLKSAKTWCIIGTVIGGFLVLIAFIGALS